MLSSPTRRLTPVGHSIRAPFRKSSAIPRFRTPGPRGTRHRSFPGPLRAAEEDAFHSTLATVRMEEFSTLATPPPRLGAGGGLSHVSGRPEAFGGFVHNELTDRSGPVHWDVLDCVAVADGFSKHGTYLLAMAFPEGSPTHPAYGAGHATVAGACTTILKAFFEEDNVIPDPVVATADVTALLPWVGPPLTVRGELNKVAANVAIGRRRAGVHWPSDYYQSLDPRECVASSESRRPATINPHVRIHELRRAPGRGLIAPREAACRRRAAEGAQAVSPWPRAHVWDYLRRRGTRW